MKNSGIARAATAQKVTLDIDVEQEGMLRNR
jgi:hypothetical protein